MEHLNIFERYTWNNNEENQLTRAFLILLKHSNSSLLMFYNYCRQYLDSKSDKTTNCLPEFEVLNVKDITYDTQRRNISYHDKLISVLINYELYEEKRKVVFGERTPFYDGLICFDDKLCFVIENKPRQGSVSNQHIILSKDSLEDMDDVELIEIPVILIWGEIIKRLNNLLGFKGLNVFENNIINDFLYFVDEYFAELNPYDRLASCKSSEELIKKRIRNILESMVTDNALIVYHQSWAWTIKFNWPEIREIGFVFEKYGDAVEWSINLALYFGQLVSQARPFYKDKDLLKKINTLGDNWIKEGMLFIRHRGSEFGKYKTTNLPRYVEYWLQNIDRVKRYSNKEKLFNFLRELRNNEIISISESELIELKRKTKPYPHLDLGPSVALIFKYDDQNAIDLDDSGELINSVKDNIINGMSIINKKIDFLK